MKEHFTNKENAAFYERMPAHLLRDRYEKQSRIESLSDVALLKLFWEDSCSLLEIGAGEGRVIDGLLQRNYSGMIFGLERCARLCKNLREKYVLNKNVKIIEQDLLDNKQLPCVDVALWLWSGMVEFNYDEQKEAIHKLGKYVTHTLCLDVPRLGTKTNATEQHDNRGELREPWGTAYAYFPSQDEILSYTADSAFKLKQSVDVQTAPDRVRTLYILSK
jgi:hypothetical protein